MEYEMTDRERELRIKLGLPLEPVKTGKPRSLEETLAKHCSPLGWTEEDWKPSDVKASSKEEENS